MKNHIRVQIGVMMLSTIALTGCISSGSIVSVKGDREAEVVVKEGFVKAGDRVAFFKTECNTPKPAKHRRCESIRVGEGKVVSREGDRALVRSDAPLDLSTVSYTNWSYPR